MTLKRQDYREMIYKARNQKFDKLKEKNPLFQLPKDERIFVIQFFKLRTAYQTYFPENYDDEQWDDMFERAYYPDTVQVKKRRWQCGYFKNILQPFVDELEHIGADWGRLQDYRKPVILSCDRHPSEGCTDCKSFKECDLKL